MKQLFSSRANPLPAWLGVVGEALLTVLHVAAFFAVLWFTWFCVWVFA